MDFFLGDAPGIAVVWIALIEEVGTVVLVGKTGDAILLHFHKVTGFTK